MERRQQQGATLRGVRVFLVHLEGHEPLVILLRALGAEVRLFSSLQEAEAVTVPTGTTVLVIRVNVADHEHDVEPVTFVVKGFGVPGVLRPEPLKPSFHDRFVEMHRGRPEALLLCASIVDAAGLSRDRFFGRWRQAQSRSPEFRVAI